MHAHRSITLIKLQLQLQIKLNINKLDFSKYIIITVFKFFTANLHDISLFKFVLIILRCLLIGEQI
jgi:hypothetical protein